MISSPDNNVVRPQLFAKEKEREEKQKEQERQQRGTSSGSREEIGEKEDKETEEMWETAIDDAQKARIKRVPLMPTQAEIDEHCATHVPFRSWCEFCVHGKAKDDPHRKAKQEREILIPEIDIDYMWLKGKFPFNQGGDDEGQPILIIKDRETKFKQSIMVPAKGVEPYAVKTLTNILARTYGYGKNCARQ